MENIRFSGPHITDEEVYDACKKSGCDSFIRKLPKRYNEMIDNSRDDISEGQKQLLRELLNGRTSIIIAHRLSQITNCDKIVVIDGGKVSEIGSHDELIANGGFYSKLYASYISG